MKFKAEELRDYGLQWAVAQLNPPYYKDSESEPVKSYYGMNFLEEQGITVEYTKERGFYPVARFEGHELEGEYWVETGLQLYVKVKVGDVIDLPDEVLYYGKPTARKLEPSTEENLLLVEDLLRSKVAPERFDLSFWGATTECGFAGCAIGWATTLPELQVKGFTLSEDAPWFGDFEGWDAVQEFFGLTEEEARYLFDEDRYPVKNVLPVMVASRIKEMLSEN